MIYMVEHTYSMPETEAEWNAFHIEYGHVLIKVPGFLSAQRFKVPDAKPSRYLAMYTIRSADVFDSEAYKSVGGGGTRSTRFRPAYKLWIRNLFDAPRAPLVLEHQRLLVQDRQQPLWEGMSGSALWLKSSGLQMTTPYRALTVIDSSQVVPPEDGVVYQPISTQLTAASRAQENQSAG